MLQNLTSIAFGGVYWDTVVCSKRGSFEDKLLYEANALPPELADPRLVSRA